MSEETRKEMGKRWREMGERWERWERWRDGKREKREREEGLLVLILFTKEQGRESGTIGVSKVGQ